MLWNLRRFTDTLSFFGAIPIVNLFQSVTAPLSMKGNKLFDFTAPDASYREVWGCLDDVVMGGVSQSHFLIEGGQAVFKGVVSTDNSGGFVSVRTRNFSPPLDLSSYTAIKLKLRGDGNRYKFFLRDSNGWDSLAYSCELEPKLEWGEVVLPFCEFIPVFRAKTVKDAPPLALQRICSLQLMLSKFSVDGKLNPSFRAGDFRLEITEIEAIE
jgi:hypothetical protein